MSYIWVPETYGVIGTTGLIKFGLHVQFNWAFIMSNGGNVLKLTISLTALFLAVTFLLSQSNSFSYAQIKSEAVLSIVPEDRALIAIVYGPGKQFEITNNTGKAIVLDRVEILGASKNEKVELGTKTSSIQPGETKRFNITGDPKDLVGKEIQVVASWNGGRTEISSLIPGSIDYKKLAEDDDPIIPVIDEEAVTDEEPVIDEEAVTDEEPVIDEEPVTDEEPITDDEPATDEEPVIDEEPVTDEEPVKEEEPVTGE